MTGMYRPTQQNSLWNMGNNIPSYSNNSTFNSLYQGNSLGDYALGNKANTLVPLNTLPTNKDGKGTAGWFSRDSLLGEGGSILGALQGFGNLYMGMQQYGMAKKALKQGREQFNKNYEAQRKTTNTAMEDRQRSRVAASSYAEDVDSYMARNRI